MRLCVVTILPEVIITCKGKTMLKMHFRTWINATYIHWCLSKSITGDNRVLKRLRMFISCTQLCSVHRQSSLTPFQICNNETWWQLLQSGLLHSHGFHSFLWVHTFLFIPSLYWVGIHWLEAWFCGRPIVTSKEKGVGPSNKAICRCHPTLTFTRLCYEFYKSTKLYYIN